MTPCLACLCDDHAACLGDWRDEMCTCLRCCTRRLPIGSGSDFDIYGGDAGCEQRAVNFGRRHLRVVVER